MVFGEGTPCSVMPVVPAVPRLCPLGRRPSLSFRLVKLDKSKEKPELNLDSPRSTKWGEGVTTR
jgi:hypothetical protein